MLLRPVLMPILRNPLQGIADGIRNMLAELLGSSQFFAPLTHSLVLARGTGSPTFTNASVARTFPDNEGILRTAIAGEARFVGARRVRNRVVNSEDFTAWTPNGTVSIDSDDVVGPDGVTLADTISFSGASAQVLNLADRTYIAGNKYLYSVWAKVGSVTKSFRFKINDGATDIYSSDIPVTTEWVRYSAVLTAGASTTAGNDSIGIDSATTAASISFFGAQLEDITGRTDQTTPSEYVSVGVLSAPYHGAGVDGVEYFNTDLTGAAIPAATNLGYLAEASAQNLCLQSEALATAPWTAGAAVITANQASGPFPSAVMDGFAPDGSAGSHFLFQDIAKAASALTYTYSVWVERNPGQTDNIVLSCSDAVAAGWAAVFDPDTGVVLSNFQAVGAGFIFIAARLVESSGAAHRISLTFTTNATATVEVVIWSTNTTNSIASYVGNGVDQFYVGGAQLELGSFASTYIPTTTAAVTRAADVLTYPSAGNIVAASGGVYAELTTLWTGNPPQNSGVMRCGTGVPAYLRSTTNTLSIFDTTTENMLTVFSGSSSVQKIATGWGGSNTKTVVAGGAIGSAAFDGDLGVTGVLEIAHGTGLKAGDTQLNGTIRNVRIWQRQLSASEMQAITA